MTLSLRPLALLGFFAPLCLSPAGAQPNLAPPAPPQVIPREPVIEPAARALLEATMARYQAMDSYSDITVQALLR